MKKSVFMQSLPEAAAGAAERRVSKTVK